jgi:hypothetical protein
MLAGALMARHNVRLGRGDRKGALRIAVFAFFLNAIHWLLHAHHPGTGFEVYLLVETIADSLWYAGVLWFFYIALEPFVRRHWPQTLIAWSRLLAGQIRDPLVGKGMLIGVVFGVGYNLLFFVHRIFDQRIADAPESGTDLRALLGVRPFADAVLARIEGTLLLSLGLFLAIFLLRLLLRKQWIAAVAFVILGAGQQLSRSDHPAIDAPLMIAIYALLVVILMRFGLLALGACIFVTNSIPALLFTADFSAWYGVSSIAIILIVLALAAWGFHTAMAGRPIFAGGE